jgi:hypothetical protein
MHIVDGCAGFVHTAVVMQAGVVVTVPVIGGGCRLQPFWS